MRAAKPLTALALTGIGTALVVGFQVPETAAVTAPVATANPSTTSATTSGTTSTTTSTTTVAASPATTATTSGSATATAAPAATGSTTTTVTTATAATYADGTYAGTAVDEPWGTFQVQAVVSGGALTDVVIVSAPQDGHSSRINSQAVPVLTEAAIASQSAAIDMVSGATWTSRSYATSLQGALDAARAAAEAA
jgi:uncharacterized protein with FMN-binding domain